MSGQKKKCKDHLGNEYNSISEMCKVYGIKETTYCKRLERGRTLEEALTGEVNVAHCKKCKDHLGNEYNSITEMCETYGLTESAFHNRLKSKWSLEEALITPKYGDKITKVRCSAKKCKDHLGNEYNSITEMCKTYDIKNAIYYNRINRGYTLEEALTIPICVDGHGHHCKKYKDHLGNEYNGRDELCKAYGISQHLFDSRIALGWSLEEALTRDLKNHKCKCKDHLGNEYASIAEMCKAYGIKDYTYRERIEHKWSLEKALTTPKYGYKIIKVGYKSKKCKDHLGNTYNSIREMCKAYCINESTYNKRLKRGLTVEEALTNPICVGGYPPKVDSFSL